MRYVEVGGVRLSAIGLGTWQFGSREWGYGDRYATRDALDITQRALDLGINLIDTAEVYGGGRSERVVARALAVRRDEAFVATKVFPALPLAPVVVQRGRASAARLGIACIDLYQVHWPNPVFPISTTMKGMRALREAGVVSRVGVSNFPLERWQEAEAALGEPVLSNQVQYSLADRRPEHELLGWAQTHDRLLIAYSPLAQGLLSARYQASNRPGGIRAINPLFLPENLRGAAGLLDALRDVGRAQGASPAQVALAWVIRRPNVVAIPGAASVAQLESNAAAADLELSAEQDELLTSASDAFRPKRGLRAVPSVARSWVGLGSG